MIQSLNLRVKINDVYLNYGFVTLITTVVTTQMNQLISVGNATARTAGNVVQDVLITDVFQSGYFVMVKTTAGMVPMSCQKIVQNVTKPATSSAEIIDVFRGKCYCFSFVANSALLYVAYFLKFKN